MLETLISLSDLITRQKTHKIEVIDEVRNSTTKIGRLYEHIANGEVETEEQAAAMLGYTGPKDKNYSNLKGKLFQKLVNSVFFLDQSESLYSDKLNAARNCYKNYTAFRLLVGYQKRNVAVKIIEKTFQFSKKYDFTDLNYMITAFLTNHYVTHTLDKKKYAKFGKLKKYYQKALIAENDIEEIKGQFNMALSKSSSGIDFAELEMYKNQIDIIREKQKNVFTQRYNLTAYMLQTNIYLEMKQYNNILKVVQEGIQFFKQRGIESSDAMFIYGMRKGIANFMLKDYVKAEQNFRDNLKIAREFSTNWFSTYNYLFSVKITRFSYIQAFSVLSIIMNSPKFEKTHPLLVQQFKIKEAYIHFLVGLGKIDPTKSEEKPLRKFRLNRFLNDVPTYSKDKRGVNISILIIQMLLLVQNKKHGEILDKLDALNMYSHRYLRSDNTFRSNCFIKMLAKLPDADYHPIRWERYVKKFRDRLDEHPFELSYHNLDLEVIPFETLYDLLLEMLQKQRK